MEQLFIGTDIGTTSTKSIAYNRAGEVIYQATKAYQLSTPTKGIAEQDPDEIFQAVLWTWQELLKQVIDPNRIKFISFSSAMHSLIGVGENGEPLTASITWADTRSNPIVAAYLNTNKAEAIYKKTGVPLHAMLPFFKILWLKKHQNQLFNEIKKFISIKEYIFFRLFNQYVVDESIAASSGIFNIQQLDWDDELINELGITRDQLSTVVKTTYADLRLTEKYQKELGFAQQTKFIIGSSDGVLANLGIGAIYPGSLAISIGTSGAVRMANKSVLLDKKARTFCYPLVDNLWIVGGPVNNGGVVLQWAKNELLKHDPSTGENTYAYLEQVADSSQAGANGMIFLPYLLGERAPIWEANAQGTFFGLRIHHKNAELIRAVMEGILFNLREVTELLLEQGNTVNEIYASGGFAKSNIWRQMMADIFQTPISVPEDYESSCLGAVLLGFYAIKEVKSFAEFAPFFQLKYYYKPNKALNEIYQDTYCQYQRIKEVLLKESLF